MDIRACVLDELRRRGRSHEWLAVRLELRGVCAAATVHRWLSGRGDTTSRIAGEALEEVGLGVSGGQETWGTVRVGTQVIVCRVGSSQWATGSWREAAGTLEEAHRMRSRRLQALARFGR